MKTGLLIYDNSKRNLSARVDAAATLYRSKFGEPATQVFVNPDETERDGATYEFVRMMLENDGVTLSTKPTIMPKHIWMGVADLIPTEMLVTGEVHLTDDATPNAEQVEVVPVSSRWFAYRYEGGGIKVKRYTKEWGKIDYDAAMDSDFVDDVTQPYAAANRAEAEQIAKEKLGVKANNTESAE